MLLSCYKRAVYGHVTGAYNVCFKNDLSNFIVTELLNLCGMVSFIYK